MDKWVKWEIIIPFFSLVATAVTCSVAWGTLSTTVNMNVARIDKIEHEMTKIEELDIRLARIEEQIDYLIQIRDEKGRK